MLFIVVRGPSYEQARKTIEGAHLVADGFEFRLDTFAGRDLNEICALRESTKKPMLFTLRKKSEGGFYPGTETERQREIVQLLTLKPDYFDLEWDVDPSFADFSTTKLIRSRHDFEGMPVDLETLFSAPAYAYKLAATARSTLDALRMLNFVKQKREQGYRLTGLCMGEEGQITRILGPVVGNFIDYAFLETEEQIAPGQISAETLCKTYHYKSLNGETDIYGLIGDPVDKSPSHRTHNRVFQTLGKNAVYVKMRLRPEEVAAFFAEIETLPVKGLSITMPLKECIALNAMGPINTFAHRTGYNTDAPGALDAIEERLPVAGKIFVLIGAGGAGKAIAYEAIRRGAHLRILNRDPKRAQALAAELGCQGYGLSEIDKIGPYDILVNTTSVGMAPAIDEAPIDSQYLLPSAIVMDAVFNPRKTRLLHEAESKGCTIIPGYEMWINQASLQFSHWVDADHLTVKKLLAEEFL